MNNRMIHIPGSRVPNIVLLGTKSFGREVAKAIEPRYNLIGVYAPTPGSDALGQWAADHNIWWGTDPSRGAAIPMHVDLVVAAHWTRRIDENVRGRAGTIIGHPSLLPRHRGIAAVEHTVLAGDPVAGFSWFRPVAAMDAGPIVHQRWCHVDPSWDASALWREALFPIGVASVVQAISKALAGIEHEQDSRFATPAPRLAKVV